MLRDHTQMFIDTEMLEFIKKVSNDRADQARTYDSAAAIIGAVGHYDVEQGALMQMEADALRLLHAFISKSHEIHEQRKKVVANNQRNKEMLKMFL